MTVEKKQFDIANVIHKLVKIFHIEANHKEVGFELSIDKELPKYLIGDETKTYYLLHNLLHHTFQHANVKRKVKLDVIVFQIVPHMEHLAGIAHVAFKIECNFTIHKPTEALSIAQFLAHILKGGINVLYQEESTIFTVELRLTRVQIFSMTNISGSPENPVKILIIEEHFLNQIAIEHILTEWSDSISIEFADDIQTAIKKHEFGEYAMTIRSDDVIVPRKHQSTEHTTISLDDIIPDDDITPDKVNIGAYVPKPKPSPSTPRSQRLEIPGSDRAKQVQRHIRKSDL